ncbi:MAG: hypothetical protein JO000_08370 [Alphaproteobacteria bacterium]|nr:hypothetical protein [Alphaproteobacteria bacterium]
MKFARRFTLACPQRGDLRAIVLALAIIVALLVTGARWIKVNHGFGLDWDCVNPGSGGAVCIKKLPAAK